GHEQRRRYALSGHIADRQAEPAIGERKKIVVVATHAACWTAMASVFKRRHRGHALREKPLLYLARDLDFAVQQFALRHLVGDGSREVRIFESETCLRRHGLEQAGVAWRVGLFGLLRPQADESQQFLTRRQGEQKLRPEKIHSSHSHRFAGGY